MADDILKIKKVCSAKEIIETAFSNEWRQASLLTVVWYLVSTLQIEVDLNKKLTMETHLTWIP